MGINPGILLMLITAFLQSSMQAVVKSISIDINTTIQLLVYYTIPLIMFIPMIMKQGLAPYKTKRFPFLLLRGVITTASVFCFFYTASHMNLGIGAVLFNTTPIFIPLLASIFLKEHTPAKVYLGILISLVGVIIVIHPKPGAFLSFYSFIGLASGFLMAVSQVMLRRLTRLNESVNNIMFYLYLTCVMSTLGFIVLEYFFNHHQTDVHLIHSLHPVFVYSMLLLLGIISFTAQRTLTKAFQHMPAGKLAPYLYVSIPISSLYGWIFWQQHIDFDIILGSLIVVIGVCIITFALNGQKPQKQNAS